jgi:hypothetical protein
MAESMKDDRGLSRLTPNPNLNLSTRTWHLMAETRDLKMGPQPIIRFPVSLCSLIFPTAIR